MRKGDTTLKWAREVEKVERTGRKGSGRILERFLLPGDLFDIHGCEMYDCSRLAYRDRVKVVSFQGVPDQWLQPVQHPSSAQP